jgi:hypothetical protein
MNRGYSCVVSHLFLLMGLVTTTQAQAQYYYQQQQRYYYQQRQQSYYPRQPSYYPRQPSYYPRQPSYYQRHPSYYPQQPPYYPQQPSYYPQQPSYFPQQLSPDYQDREQESPSHYQPQRQSRETIGTLFTAGSHVTVNGQSGTNGRSLRSGDTIATGSASSALMTFDGRVMQLDQNTKLEIRLHSPDNLKCTLSASLTTGQIFLNGHSTCVRNGRVLFAVHSEVDYEFASGGSPLGVKEGEVVVQTPAERVSVPAPARVSLGADGRVLEQQAMTDAEWGSMTAWRKAYTFQQ